MYRANQFYLKPFACTFSNLHYFNFTSRMKVVILKRKRVTWPALGSSKIWILVPDWSIFWSLEPNAGHLTRKIYLRKFSYQHLTPISQIYKCREFQKYKRNYNPIIGFLRVEIDKGKKCCQMGRIGCPILLAALKTIMEFQFPVDFWNFWLMWI